MLKVALTGSTGLIGSRIIELLKNDFQFIPLLQEEVDITDKEGITRALNNIDFDLLLHLAAYTNVDLAETNKDLVHRINVEGTRNVFQAVKNKGKQFIYVSTDFVFDGVNPPYFEDNSPKPISTYGRTKYEGEKIVGQEGMIIRISYPYRKSFALKQDFVRGIRSALEQRKNLFMVTDALITPTFIDDIAFGLKYLFNNYSPEIFHLVGADSLSPYEAGKLIAKTFNLNQSLIQPISYKDYFQGKAPRPQYSEIKSKKNHFCRMKTFSEGLTACQ